jgi:L-threonylcarbamoyladenylate synthase
MKTLRLTVLPEELATPASVAALETAADLLRRGGLVALPTETVYGLGANALDSAAVERIYRAKQRPTWDPIIVHVSSMEMLEPLVEEIPERARRLMEAYWPGPLTLLLRRTAAIPDVVTAGRPLMGVRMPSHPVALELIRRAGVPVAAPSANLFAHTSPTTAQHVLEDLDGRIDAVVDSGASRHGVESTVLDPSQEPMVIYRPGAVTLEQVRATAGPVEMHISAPTTETPREALPSPGVGLRHYAPKARLLLVEVTSSTIAERLAETAREQSEDRLGVLLPTGVVAPAGTEAVWDWGHWENPVELAAQLYAGLRALDAAGCTTILCPRPEAGGIGAALLDRLQKAATPRAKPE